MKIFRLSAVVLAAAFVALAVAALPSRLCFENGKNYVFYCGTSSKDCREVFAGDNAALTRLTLTDVFGESAEYDDFSLDEFLKSVNGRIVRREEGEGYVNYYCAADLPYSLMLDGVEINLHICVRDSGVKVASPIIFGGY